jgi:hypothetical protein
MRPEGLKLGRSSVQAAKLGRRQRQLSPRRGELAQREIKKWCAGQNKTANTYVIEIAHQK